MPESAKPAYLVIIEQTRHAVPINEVPEEYRNDPGEAYEYLRDDINWVDGEAVDSEVFFETADGEKVSGLAVLDDKPQTYTQEYWCRFCDVKWETHNTTDRDEIGTCPDCTRSHYPNKTLQNPTVVMP